MVQPQVIAASNGRIPANLTAVFVGATSGIACYTLKAFAKHCRNPRAYFVGRSQSAADQILQDLKAINPAGEYVFIKSDVSLLKNVDKVSQEIRAREQYINLLVLSTGTMIRGVNTEEGLSTIESLIIHARTRFTLNLLPLLQAAPTLRRVLSIFTGSKEGPMEDSDFHMRNMGVRIMRARGQAASTVTLALERVAKRAPDVSFIHDFPGPVRSNIARGGGMPHLVMRTLFKAVAPFVCIPNDVSGDRHLYLATSARYPAQKGGLDGAPLGDGVEVAKGSDGEAGSGVYIIDENCESAGLEVEDVLRTLRKDGKEEWVWKHIYEDYMRITGKECI